LSPQHRSSLHPETGLYTRPQGGQPAAPLHCYSIRTRKALFD
jgi:hypothetical protein